MNELFVLRAEICKTLANPMRLEILNALRGGEVSVASFVASHISVNLFLLADGATAAKRGQKAPTGYYVRKTLVIVPE